MSQLIDLDRLYQAVSEIATQIIHTAIPDIIPVNKGGTGVTTEEEIRSLVTGTPNKIWNGSNQVVIGPVYQYVSNSESIMIGADLLPLGVRPTKNIFIGYNFGLATTNTSGNIIMGMTNANAPELTMLTDNIIFGENNLEKTTYDTDTSAQRCLRSVIIGRSNLQGPTDITDNYIIGQRSFFRSTGRVTQTIAIGHETCANRSDTIQGIILGQSAFTGARAGIPDPTLITSSNDIVIGGFAAQYTAKTVKNVFIGFQAGTCTSKYTNFSYCIAIGSNAMYGNQIDDLTDAVAIGRNAAVTGSKQFQLGSSGYTVYAYGAVQNRSDARDKVNITDIEYPYREFIMGLRPVTFQWDYREDYRGDPDDENYQDGSISEIKKDGTHIRSRRHNGFIAQEVKALMDSLGFDFAGYQDHSVNGGDDVLSLGYTEFIAPMVKMIQDLSKKVDVLTKSIEELKVENAGLKSELQSLK